MMILTDVFFFKCEWLVGVHISILRVLRESGNSLLMLWPWPRSLLEITTEKKAAPTQTPNFPHHQEAFRFV